jgi:hypothetical protein
MDCQDVRLLLAFLRRGGDAIDPTERATVQQHLENCPDCAALARSEKAVDIALGAAMRAVPVPAGLKERLLAKVAATGPRRWPITAIAAAAALLLAVGVTGWAMWPLPRVDALVAEEAINGRKAESMKQWFAERGIDMEPWTLIDHSTLWTYDVVEFQGQRVPKLIFYSNRDRGAVAEVLVLRADRFNTHDLNHGRGFPGQTPNQILVDKQSNPEFVYLAGFYEGNQDAFLMQGAH